MPFMPLSQGFGSMFPLPPPLSLPGIPGQVGGEDGQQGFSGPSGVSSDLLGMMDPQVAALMSAAVQGEGMGLLEEKDVIKRIKRRPLPDTKWPLLDRKWHKKNSKHTV
jgi:hypothetical protein